MLRAGAAVAAAAAAAWLGLGHAQAKAREPREKRIFDHRDRDECWRKAAVVPGRSPDRWRYDTVGNVVCKRLHTCMGPLCVEYDHIIPFSQGGQTTGINCQILQTRVNRLKGNKTVMTMEQMRSLRHPESNRFTAAELDTVERAVYGDVERA